MLRRTRRCDPPTHQPCETDDPISLRDRVKSAFLVAPKQVKHRGLLDQPDTSMFCFIEAVALFKGFGHVTIISMASAKAKVTLGNSDMHAGLPSP